MDSVRLAALIGGIVLGSVMLIISCAVYWRKQVFGVGGSFLTTLGFLLVGLSIWTSFDLSISPEGEVKLSTQLYQTVAEATKDAAQQVISEAQRGLVAHSEMTASPPEARPPNTIVTRSEQAAPVGHSRPLDQDTLDRLRVQEKVRTLIDKKDYLEAMELDPTNVLPIMYYIQQSVLRGKYGEAVSLFRRLQDTNDSGVGYSVYPDLVIAFERSGDSDAALDALNELRTRIAQDMAQGYGYLSRSQQLHWVDTSLAKAESLVSDSRVQGAIGDLRADIAQRIAALTDALTEG